MNNESFENGNGDSMNAKQKVKFRHHSGKSKVNIEHSFDLGTTKPDRTSNLNFRRGGRSDSL